MDSKLATRVSRRPPPQPPAATRSAVWLIGLLVVLCFFSLPLFLALSRGRPNLSDVWHLGVSVTARDENATAGSESSDAPPPASRDRLLGGLLSPDISEGSCLSRMGLVECRYLVWAPTSGHIGDRVLSIASAFLYALLTRRVLLLQLADDMAGLFCEPFPGATWELPAGGFLPDHIKGLRRGSDRSYGNFIRAAKNKKDGSDDGPAGLPAESLPPYAYVHLEHDYQQPEQLFFCDDDQTVLSNVNWLILRSNLYFAAGLFLVPQFEEELRWMFPASDTAFHHVGRYLFHPSNEVWQLITRYYTSYMASFEENIGLQITTFAWNPVPFEEYFKQVSACTSQEKILPEVDTTPGVLHEATAATSKAVLVSSEHPEYAEKLKSMYYEHATVTGETVSVLQPGGGGNHSHNQKAVVEMFLQSYCDVSVVSGWSTVGYVGHGLAGLKPWLLLAPRNQTAADPPCVQATSMEPCFHAPPSYDCRAKKKGDLGAVLRHVRHCEDVGDGLKLFD
ncbi:galactoside 2-alpha-L-fucosyltransferase-like isoform X2 [Triticum dicoccoides]|uniref:galactoside 2-alpha-L-fucosyltransferase-like isoform X2 n=1 Tax=Triticum dicoccoides TaxID=85692 RepID=UPI001891A2AF|nr:galactoside 2-alpha-L-fucosyltransferase-like isoform X2 [Triticum dicoccoides]